MSAFRIETEAMTLSGYRLESKSLASGGKFISLVGGEPAEIGTASFAFSGPSGIYDVVVGYFDESDGISRLQVRKQGVSIDNWNLNQNLGSSSVNTQTLVRRAIATRLSIKPEERIEILGSEDQGEPARVDYIEFIPVVDPVVDDAPIRIEAETMNRATYRVKTGSFASGGQLLSLSGGAPAETGTASFAFSGPSGVYDVVVGYFDESDGISRLQVRKQGVSIDAWDLNQNRGSSAAGARTLVPRTVATGLTVNQGETIAISATENAGEPASVDYIEFIPLTSTTINGTDAGETLRGNTQNNGINGLGGNDTLEGGAGKDLLNGGSGIDTVSYQQASQGVIVNLGTNIAFTSAYSKPLKIMPLGDSITYGVVDSSKNDRESGGYRTPLWNKLVANGLGVDFVGSVSSGPSSLGDQDHEGHPGWTSQQIATNINGWLDTSKPDVVLLMIGTNDARKASASIIGDRLSALIEQITTQVPNSHLLVASVPPIDGAFESNTRAQRAAEFNSIIPSIVNSKAAQGKKVTFVDTRSDLTLSDLADGLHPNAGGYDKISDYWYNAILNTSGEKDTLSNIENITGSAFNDVLMGNAGINVIQGDAGADTLTGDDGADTFVYKETGGKDIITDFTANDLFSISASGFGGGLVAGINLKTTDSTTGVFVSSATPTSLGNSANFLYNTNTGLLNFDRDGTGSDAAFAVAMLTGAPSLGVAQFVISS